jgi:hypothetical protein
MSQDEDHLRPAERAHVRRDLLIAVFGTSASKTVPLVPETLIMT